MAYKMLYLARRAKDVAWEDWPRTWKSHAIFASQFPAMSGTIDWMRYTTRIDDPAMDDLPVSREHDGVSVAEAPKLETFQGKGFTPEQRAEIDKDELRVFDRYTPNFSFYCTENRVQDGPLGEAAVFRFLKRKDGVSRSDFDAFLNGEFAAAFKDFAVSAQATRAAINFSIDAPPPDFAFDAITETWFVTPEEGATALRSANTEEQITHLAQVCDTSACITMFTRPTHRWPREPRPA